ncbi:MAG: SLBB domain-containing protein [Planctomycetaceae bacterium]|nr:SLBB domain-containing protein [Planctomycetaceae bacterium]
MNYRRTGGNAKDSQAPFFITVALLCILTGCRSDNHFFAESLPMSLRLAAQSNPQEADLSGLASANGSSEVLGPGDVLDVSIAAGLTEKDQVKLSSRIADDGNASLPEIGTIQLAGYPPQAAESLIRMEAIKKNLYKNPSVTVTVSHARKNRIRVLGAVKQPGIYELPPSASDVVSAIAEAGGLAENAGENVEVRNPVSASYDRPAIAGDPQNPYSPVSSSSAETPVASTRSMNSYRINLISASKDGGGDYLVSDGGVIMVEKRDPDPVSVIGLVKNPGKYDFPVGKDIHVLDAIALAGGISNQLANKVYVIRPVANGANPAVIELTIYKAKRSGDSNIRLGPGDVVSVEQTPGTVFMEALQIIRFGVSGSVGTLF